MPMKALDRALLRDLLRLRAQVLTLGLVVACGAAVFVSMKMTVDALDGARGDYFRAQRFADLFVSLKRAPRALLPDLQAISGVAELEGRVVGDVPLFVSDHSQPATVHLVSLDPRKPAPLDAVRIQKGRLPDPEHDDELVLNEPFAEATHLEPGDRVSAVLNGRLRRLRVVGIGISPEFVFQMAPGALSPNDERYGVAWLSRAPLESAFDLGGALNDVVVRLAPGAVQGEVIDCLDRQLARYGGRGAFGRDRQMSARFLDVRIERIRGMLVFLPALFLLVAAFVLNVVLGRLVQGQREQIGALKAFGYGNGRLARHYLSLAALAVLPGALAGIAGGLELGGALIRQFVHFFRLPLAGYALDWAAIGGALAVVFGAAAVGALQAMRSVVALHPVEAMRPPSPPVYRKSALERWGLLRRVPTAAILIVRNLRTAPLRAGASVAALAFATALCITGSFFGGSIDALVRHQFDTAMREDLSVAFARPVDRDACASLVSLEGVTACEPLASVPVRARVGPQSRQVAITALAEPGRLRRIIDLEGRPVPVPPSGLLVSRRLLDQLGASVGDGIVVETLEGRPRRVTLPVRAAVADELGLNLYASLATLTTLTGELPLMSSALLRVAPGREHAIVERLGRMPAIIGVTSRSAAIADFEKATAASMRVMTFILALLSASLAIAVVYNGARVALAERARDLASLRVLGFTRGEVSTILFGEMGLVLALGVPLGLILGRAFAVHAATGTASDEFRMPMVITMATYALSVLVVVGASLLSALQLRRLIDRLDLVEVLKTRE
jgi:putative ABC transport system permease protein